MHIPDNYLSPSTCAVFGAAMLPVWKRAVSKVKQELTREKLPMLAVGAAFSFLIMMFNLPLPGGTTGHAVGAALVAILLGPYSAILSITAALVVQALFFGDGGILAIGVNTFNMAFIMPITAHYVYNLIKGNAEGKRQYVAAFIASYISLNTAALFAAFEFGIQPLLFKDASGLPIYCPYPLNISIPAMLIPHLLIVGFVEGIVTSLVLAYVKKVSPGIIYKGEKVKYKTVYYLIGILVILCPVGLIASGTAWGEWGADEIGKIAGFVPHALKNGFSFNAIMPDYGLPGLPEIAGYLTSAIIGVIILLVIFKLFGIRTAKQSKK